MQRGAHITRQQFTVGILAVLWILLTVRIAQLQVIEHGSLQARARDQRIKEVTIKGRRGIITDRNGVALATNLDAASYGIRPDKVGDIAAAAVALASATGLDRKEIDALLSREGFQWLVRQADTATIERLDALELPGLEKFPETRRCYPLGKIAAQLVGYTDVDGAGIDGAEFFLNDVLEGRDGRSKEYRDARHRVTPSFEDPLVAARDGRDVALTIDWRIQEIAEEELEEGVAKFNAISGGVLIVDTATGEILAMANVPRFDPNDPKSYDPKSFPAEFRKNRLATDMMEPGSTFKIVAFAEAIEHGDVSELDLINCDNGKMAIGTHTIHDSHEMAVVPARDVLIHSSNIGTVKIADRIGKRRLYERACTLGFGSVTGYGFPDESPGRLANPRTWSNLSLPTISFGQGVAVSPLQLSMAYGAIANGGSLLRPRIIKSTRAADGTIEKNPVPSVIRQAMTPETSRRMADMLCGVVEEGTGMAAAIPTVRLAGKTGTAQRIQEGKKGYVEDKYLSSFIGFVADRNPRILCYVMVDSPQGLHYGSQVAAPVFKNIINRMLNMGDSPWGATVAGSDTSGVEMVTLPDVRGMSALSALARLSMEGFTGRVVGDSTTVLKQMPLPGASLPRGATVTVFGVASMIEGTAGVPVPDLTGKSLREAVQSLVQANLKVSVKGTGFVAEQTPAPGTLVAFGTVCTIACNRQ